MKGSPRLVRLVPVQLYCSRRDHYAPSNQFEIKANGCYHSWCIDCKRWYQRVFYRRKSIRLGKPIRPNTWKGPK